MASTINSRCVATETGEEGEVPVEALQRSGAAQSAPSINPESTMAEESQEVYELQRGGRPILVPIQYPNPGQVTIDRLRVEQVRAQYRVTQGEYQPNRRGVELFDTEPLHNPNDVLDREIRRWFERYRTCRRKRMNSSLGSLKQSWNRFVDLWNQGILIDDIHRHEEERSTYDLGVLRAKAHEGCRWSEVPCIVDCLEGCHECNPDGGERLTLREWKTHPNHSNLTEDDSFYCSAYERAVSQSRGAASRRASRVDSRSRSQYREHRSSAHVPTPMNHHSRGN